MKKENAPIYLLIIILTFWFISFSIQLDTICKSIMGQTEIMVKMYEGWANYVSR